MTIEQLAAQKRDLMRPILALYSYNRGYESGVTLTGNKIGGATIKSIALPDGSQSAVFYVIAYDMTGVEGFN